VTAATPARKARMTEIALFFGSFIISVFNRSMQDLKAARMSLQEAVFFHEMEAELRAAEAEQRRLKADDKSQAPSTCKHFLP
jgi:hypothetical protein